MAALLLAATTLPEHFRTCWWTLGAQTCFPRMLEQNAPPLGAEVGKMTAGARCIKLETLDSCGDGHMALFRDGGSSSQAETPGRNLLDAVEAPPLGNLATDAQVHSAVVSGSTSSSAINARSNMDRHGDYPSARSSCSRVIRKSGLCIAGAHALWYTTTGHTRFEHTGTTLPAKAQFDTICDLQQEYHLREDERVQPDRDVLVHT